MIKKSVIDKSKSRKVKKNNHTRKLKKNNKSLKKYRQKSMIGGEKKSITIDGYVFTLHGIMNIDDVREIYILSSYKVDNKASTEKYFGIYLSKSELGMTRLAILDKKKNFLKGLDYITTTFIHIDLAKFVIDNLKECSVLNNNSNEKKSCLVTTSHDIRIQNTELKEEIDLLLVNNKYNPQHSNESIKAFYNSHKKLFLGYDIEHKWELENAKLNNPSIYDEFKFKCLKHPYYLKHKTYMDGMLLNGREYYNDLILLDLSYNFNYDKSFNNKCGSFIISEVILDEFKDKHNFTIELSTSQERIWETYFKSIKIQEAFLKKYYKVIPSSRGSEFPKNKEGAALIYHNNYAIFGRVSVQQEIYELELESKPEFKVCVSIKEKFLREHNGQYETTFSSLDEDIYDILILHETEDSAKIRDIVSKKGLVFESSNINGGISKYKYLYMKYKLISDPHIKPEYTNKVYNIPIIMIPNKDEDSKINPYGVYNKCISLGNYFCKAFEYQHQCRETNMFCMYPRKMDKYYFLGDLISGSLVIDEDDTFMTSS
jgi:hypothetical protein